MTRSDPELVGTAEAAEMLGVHPSTITRWVKKGTLTPVIRGTGPNGEMFFDRADIVRIRETGKVSAA